jgi:hypothetical protein
MIGHKLNILFVVILLKFISAYNLNCEIRSDQNYRELFKAIPTTFQGNGKVCGFQDGNATVDLVLDGNLNGSGSIETVVYISTSISILPAELYKEHPGLKTSCFFNIRNINISQNWFKHSGSLENLFFYKNEIPTLRGGNFVNLKNLLSLKLRSNGIKEIEESAFSGLESLAVLDLQWNKL